MLIWIGGLKFADYEADGITPFVANSPFMSFFYTAPREYKTHVNKEGELVLKNKTWQDRNGTYSFSHGLGILLIAMGFLLILDYASPYAGLLGSILVMIMSIGTLSFLITTPECWVPDLGDGDHGFPYLSARGRLVIKDVIMLGAAFHMIGDSARRILNSSNINDKVVF
ncbi:DUF417 family protein [Mucilaginibacter gynuensis]|uniref:DUF417 family protein n=1 Tax=Mucilaginibacter gynuensis TaxID=1302236 RepID=A0ABP8G5U5_9SPHI